MKISLVVPNRNNLRYFKWMYDSVRKNQGDHEVWICSADDACSDGTAEHFLELAKVDPYFKYITNEGPERVGHTILYDRIVNELVETDLAVIFHCDMYLCPVALDAIEKLMYSHIAGGDPISKNAPIIHTKFPNKNRIVSLTRIEPPLHPGGYEKILWDCGTEPEDFDEVNLLKCLKNPDLFRYGYEPTTDYSKITNGVFAPWVFWVDEFKEIGGHDKLFAPQSKEDDDIWNRFILNGTELIQTWEGFVYHLTCRGNRRNVLEGAENIETDNPEWVEHNMKSARNFVRKWGYFIKHDEWHHPIVSHKYNITFVITNATYDMLHHLEIWCDMIAVDLRSDQIIKYIDNEQPNTKYNLYSRIVGTDSIENCDIIVEIDGNTFAESDHQNIQNLSDIITQSGEIGSFELGNLKVQINALTHYEKDLIVVNNDTSN